MNSAVIDEDIFEEFCSNIEQDPAAKQDSGLPSPAASAGSQPRSLEDPYFGERDPSYVLKKEEPQHRAILVLACEGYTNTEIAEKLGFTTAMVSYVKKQPWALEFMAKVQGESARGVKKVLTGGALKAAELLVQAVEGGMVGAKGSDRIKAANDILNRLYGTAPQLVVHGKIDPKDLSDEELAQMLKVSQ